MEPQVAIKNLIDNIEKVIIGKRDVIELIVIGLLTNSHILIEDVPGVGKTMLARALAKSINADFKRIQFTPDLLPADVVGSSIYNQKTMKFEFQKGPVFTNILLADEINRTTPRTQSALLECMQEYQVTGDGTQYSLSLPFFVMATENPIEFQGTYPLPEAQIDRFMMKIEMGYPSIESEIEIIKKQQKAHPIDSLTAVLEPQDVIALQDKVKEVNIVSDLFNYIVKIVSKTRESKEIKLGCSPRASIALMHAVKAYAMIKGEEYVVPDDIIKLSHWVLRHRIILQPQAEIAGLTHKEVISKIVKQVEIPA